MKKPLARRLHIRIMRREKMIRIPPRPRELDINLMRRIRLPVADHPACLSRHPPGEMYVNNPTTTFAGYRSYRDDTSHSYVPYPSDSVKSTSAATHVPSAPRVIRKCRFPSASTNTFSRPPANTFGPGPCALPPLDRARHW